MSYSNSSDPIKRVFLTGIGLFILGVVTHLLAGASSPQALQILGPDQLNVWKNALLANAWSNISIWLLALGSALAVVASIFTCYRAAQRLG